MSNIYILLLLLLCSMTAQAADLNKYVLTGKRISTADGLANDYVYDMVQDPNGFIWIGANYGLSRYDGYSFANYYSLSSNQRKKIDANVGNLYLDKTHNILWIHSATFTFACYDLKRGRFVDYTGNNDENRSFRRLLRNDGELWLYDPRSGLRHITYHDGQFVCTDYNKDNGKLPTNRINRVIERPGSKEVWVLTDAGLFVIESDGSTRLIAKGQFYEGNVYGNRILCLRENNIIDIYENRRKHWQIKIPSPLGTLKTIRSNIVWQDKWLIFSGNTYCIDLKTNTVSKPEKYQVSNGLLLNSIDGYYFESNKTGKLWIFPPKGEMQVLNLIPDVKFTAERNRKYNIARGKNGLFYIASYGNGFFLYDHPSGNLRHFSANDPQPVIDTNFLLNIMVDGNGDIWIAQESTGVAFITMANESLVSYVMPMPNRKGDWANYVRMAVQKRDGNVVVSTKDNKLYELDLRTNDVSLLQEMKASAYSYLEDSEGHTWIATRGAGLYVDGVNYTKTENGRRIPSNDLYNIAQDKYGRIWIATYEDGLLMTKYEEGKPLKFKQLLTRSINEGRLHHIAIDKNGRIWIASNNGLYTADINKHNITNDDFTCFNTSNSNFPYDEVKHIVMASDGHLWTGGKGSGIVRCSFAADYKKLEYTEITNKQGLANNNICSITEDRYGNIWVATENGLSHIYDKDFKVKTYRARKLFERNIYSEGCATKLADGRLMLGTRYGLAIVTPKHNAQTEKKQPAICITDIRVNGISASDSSLFALAPDCSDEVALAYNENTISITFSNFDYADIESALYQYYLEGADKDWKPLTSVNHVEYGNLHPGKYVFHLRSLSNNQWSAEKTLTIIIRQPWYNTGWAWFIYLLLAAAVIYYLYRNWRDKFELHQKMRLEKQLTEFKLGFFTNITHEFRTPLAIIQGAVDKIDQGGMPNKAAIQTARRGTKRLLRLVNQLMEFRKVNTGNMRLSVEEGNIIKFVRDIYQDFWSIAKQKEMQITFTPFAKSYSVPFDKQLVETMVYNLLSNAVKYAPERGNIAVRIALTGGQLSISVEDNGQGISEEQTKQLFQPFMNGYTSRGGMGIGLYTAHRMAEIHKGVLQYERMEKEGCSRFTLLLPADAAAYTEEDYRKATAINTAELREKDEVTREIIRELKPEAFNDITIALIEDDADMMEQLKEEIGVYFRIKGYTTGESALKGIMNDKPELVICDVMLPDMNGYDITQRLKSKTDIPVIMLTALDDENHQIRSYKAGADDYMVKPCNFRLLIARAIQLISKHKAALAQQSAETAEAKNAAKAKTAESLPQGTIITSQADKHFLEKIQTIIAQRISDPNFTVDQLAATANMGRTKFFNKTKELTGMSPNKYLQTERMRMAAELLREGELTVAEVSYRVGIQDASYFNKCFKAAYGVVPSKYR